MMNTDLWERFWAAADAADARRRADEEEHTRRFTQLEMAIEERLGGLVGRRVAELGAGAGTHAFLFARRGARAAVVDRSPAALRLAEELFRTESLAVEPIDADLLQPPPQHRDSFDVVMSFGVVEHYRGKQRVDVVRAHFDWLRPEGVALVSVPNSLCPSYRGWKWWLERSGRWEFGYEQPFSPSELRRAGAIAGATDIAIVGSSAVGDAFRFFAPVVAFKLSRGRVALPELEVASPLDRYLGYSLTLVATKPRLEHAP